MEESFEIIQENESYLMLRSVNGNITSLSDEVLALGGKAYDTGSICADPETEHRHEITCKVLYEFGLDTSEDVIVILNPYWVQEIDQEIEKALRKQH